MTTRAPEVDAPLMLSVSGARGIVGRTMTPTVAADFAAAFGAFVGETISDDRPTICIGRDSRPSGEMLESAAVAGLASVGCRVIRLGVVATPTVGLMIDVHRADGGLVVTASHNPRPWNGLKCLNRDGVAPPKDDASRIIESFRARSFEYAPVEALAPCVEDGSATERHVQRVLDRIDPEPIRARGLRVVLDSVNGAGCAGGRRLLEALGCEVVHLNGEPTGLFAHTPEPVEANLDELIRTTAAEDVACGFAQDPDADRLAIVADDGTYVGEELTLVLAAWRVLERHGPGPIAVNLSTSRMIDDLAARYPGTTVIRTAVGEANVVAGMKSAAARLGGEGNGGVIFPPVCWVRDSLSAMALVLELLAAGPRSLAELVADLPRYEMIKHTFDLGEVGGDDAVERAIDRICGVFASEHLNTVDGVRVDLADGWVHFRPSNTEPIVRLIAEAATRERAWELVDEVAVAAGLR